MRKLINVIYGLGGAVILIGILFKMLGLEHASEILTCGLVTEAAVFVVMAFDFSHIDTSNGSEWMWTIKKEKNESDKK